MSATASTGESNDANPPEASLFESVRFNVSQVLPQLLRGMFIRRTRWSSLLDRWHPDPLGVGLIAELRDRYGSDYIWLSVAGTPSLLVLDPDGIREVLDASPESFGPPDLKVRGMSHFQPGAVTISTGSDWKRRREFNEEVLAVGRRIHPRASDFLDVVGREVASLVPAEIATVGWPEIHEAFRRITGGVVFGSDLDVEPILTRLDRLRRRANRIVGDSETAELEEFREEVRRSLCAPKAGGLSEAACPHLEPGDPLPVAGQVPHWLFAMKDTLATNCTYALSLIAAHPDIQRRARSEMSSADLSDPGSVDAMAYLEGCFREAMRLWPTTPMIVRKVLQGSRVGGHRVEKGQQVLIHNGFNHRNPRALSDPDGFHPERWEQGVWDYRFNPMSNGPQACAGRELVLFLGKAVLARLLLTHRWSLPRPDLDPDRPLPHAFDPVAVELSASSL